MISSNDDQASHTSFNDIQPSYIITPGHISSRACTRNDGVKILGNGELTAKLTVKAAKFTQSAIEKIEKAGGKAEVM